MVDAHGWRSCEPSGHDRRRLQDNRSRRGTHVTEGDSARADRAADHRMKSLAAAATAPSLAPPPPPGFVREPATGVTFPTSVRDMSLLGVSVQRKTIFKIKVYAIGLYVADSALSGPLAVHKGKVGTRLRVRSRLRHLAGRKASRREDQEGHRLTSERVARVAGLWWCRRPSVDSVRSRRTAGRADWVQSADRARSSSCSCTDDERDSRAIAPPRVVRGRGLADSRAFPAPPRLPAEGDCHCHRLGPVRSGPVGL